MYACSSSGNRQSLAPSPTYLQEHGIHLHAAILRPKRHLFIKPRVPYMIFNLGDSVSESTSFCLEGHQELLNDHHVLGRLVYTFLECECAEGDGMGIPRLLKSSFDQFTMMLYRDRPDKLTTGKQKFVRARKARSKHFYRRKVCFY